MKQTLLGPEHSLVASKYSMLGNGIRITEVQGDEHHNSLPLRTKDLHHNKKLI